MKILFTTLLFMVALASNGQLPVIPEPTVAHPDTIDLYLNRMPIVNFTHSSTTFQGTKLVVTTCCGILYKNNARFVCNDTTGVRLENGNLFIPDYIGVELERCDSEYVDGYKQSFYLEPCGDPFPYERKDDGSLRWVVRDNAYDFQPGEWDSLKAYGRQSSYTYYDSSEHAFIPDTALANNNCMQTNIPNYSPSFLYLTGRSYFVRYSGHVWKFISSSNQLGVTPTEGLIWHQSDEMGADPFYDCATGVTLYHQDCYTNQFDMTGTPDGVYLCTVKFKIPATTIDLPMYPNFYTHNCRVTSGVFSWTDDPLEDCCPSVVPVAVTNVTADAQPKDAAVTITYIPGSSSECLSYLITPFNVNTGRSLTNISVTTTSSIFPYPKSILRNAMQQLGINGTGKFRFDVQAVNGTQVSTAVRSGGNPVNIQK